jgi:hypothetical protein
VISTRARQIAAVGALLGQSGAIALLLGCGGSGATSVDAGPASSDAGGAVRSDDASTGAALDALDPSLGGDGGEGFLGEGAGTDDAANALVCFDGFDQDGDRTLDCAEDDCATTRVCCVGSTDAACCADTPLATSLALAGCASGDPRACAELGARLVAGTPVVSADHALVPVSTGGLDGALDFPSLALRPRGERLTLRAQISAPASTGQLDATAFGVWAPQLPTGTVSPVVAIVVSATRGDVSIVSGTRVIASTELVGGDTEHVLEIEPTGDVRVQIGKTTLGPFAIELPTSAVVPVVFGRVQNDAYAGGTTRLRSLEVERRACDLPAALGRTGEVLPESGSAVDESQASDPSVLVRDGLEPLVAFATRDDGSNDGHTLFIGTLRDGSVLDVAPMLTSRQLETLLALTDITDLGAPDLYEEAGVVSAYVAYERGGAWNVARVTDVLGPSPIGAPLALGSGQYDHPARLPNGRLLVRERTAAGASRFVLYDVAGELAMAEAGICGARASCEAERTDTFVLEPSSDPLAFDRDEVSAPVAIEHAGVTRIYYAGRRGTRWSLGLLVQGRDQGFFRAGNDGLAVLGPTGQGPDALGVASPAAFVEGGELVLLYAGTDGAHWRLLSARMPMRP